MENTVRKLGKSVRKLGKSIRKLGKSVRNLRKSVRKLGKSVRKLGKSGKEKRQPTLLWLITRNKIKVTESNRKYSHQKYNFQENKKTVN